MAPTLATIDYPGRARSASVEISDEVLLHECEAAWTQVDAGCTVNVNAAYKHGDGATNKSASFVIAAAAAQGIQARVAPAVDNTDISAKTHLFGWLRTSAALAADDIRLGFDNTADAGGTQRYVSVPAVTTLNTWVGLQLPLVGLMTAAELAALSSVSTLILYLQNADWEGTILLDHLKVVTIDTPGDNVVVIPERHQVDNANAVTNEVDVVAFPFETELVSSSPFPVAATLIPYKGEPGDWATTDEEQGHIALDATDYLDNEPRRWTSLGIQRSADIPGGDSIFLEIAEAQR